MRPHYPLLLLAVATTLQAEGEPSLGELMQGFDDAPSSLESVIDGFDAPDLMHQPADNGLPPNGLPLPAHDPRSSGPYAIDGDLGLSAAWNTAHDAPPSGGVDQRGLSRLRAKVNLQFDYDLNDRWAVRLGGRVLHDFAYGINGRSDYPQPLLDSQEDESELHEAWLRGRLGAALDLKLGRQIVVWGKSDNLRLTDLLNPMDQREIGMVDIEDLRLPTGMARLDAYRGDWSFSAIAIPEVRFNKEPAFGSDFYPLASPAPHEVRPSSGGDHSEYALALNGIFSGWDLALYRAWVYDDNAYLQPTATGAVRQHARIQMSGVAANWAVGSWLLKGELARFDGLRLTAIGAAQAQSGLLLGVEYAGLRDTTLSWESLVRRWDDYSTHHATVGIARDNYQHALRASYKLLHDRLELTLLRLASGAHFEGGGLTRLSADYDLADALNLSLGYVDYQWGHNLPFSAIGDNDRLFAELRYSF